MKFAGEISAFIELCEMYSVLKFTHSNIILLICNKCNWLFCAMNSWICSQETHFFNKFAWKWKNQETLLSQAWFCNSLKNTTNEMIREKPKAFINRRVVHVSVWRHFQFVCKYFKNYSTIWIMNSADVKYFHSLMYTFGYTRKENWFFKTTLRLRYIYLGDK